LRHCTLETPCAMLLGLALFEWWLELLTTRPTLLRQVVAVPVSFGPYRAYLSPIHASWFPIDVSATWPPLAPGTYYWVVLAPASTTNLALEPNELTSTKYDGITWAGVPASTLGLVDPTLFTGRELRSSTGGLDTDPHDTNDSPNAVTFLANAANWSSLPGAATRLTNWAKRGSVVRYGVQLVGRRQFLPTRTATSSHLSACVCTLGERGGGVRSRNGKRDFRLPPCPHGLSPRDAPSPSVSSLLSFSWRLHRPHRTPNPLSHRFQDADRHTLGDAVAYPDGVVLADTDPEPFEVVHVDIDRYLL
jgi:hypothetical protein